MPDITKPLALESASELTSSSNEDDQADHPDSINGNSDDNSTKHANNNVKDIETEKKLMTQDEEASFEDLGIIHELCQACERLGYSHATPIQSAAIPRALEGRDVIGLAETGSGKTAAFAIPILQKLWQNPSRLFAVVLAPTRELAFQISEQFESLGKDMGVSSVVIVGGVDMVQQAVAISKKPHILVCTPGRLQDHLENTKGFSLRSLKFLIMDEADRLLDLDFGPAIDKILKFIPHGRQTMLFSATMTSRVEKLQRASLVRPVRVAVSTKFQTVSTLLQSYIFIPFKYKDTYAVFLVKELTGNTLIIFARTCNDTERLTLLLRELGLPAVALHGQMNQSSRLAALGKFKDGDRSILVATDVAARGLDIPSVDCVLNYDIPTDSKSYIHRVGRTARAGRAGKSVSLVTQYDLELFLRIEAAIGKKMTERKTDKEKVMALVDRVNEAQRVVASAMKDKRLRRESKREGKHVSSSGKRQKRSH